MKLKMAENSLFAILLRSPWWVSLAIALGLGLLARLLLPERFVVPGVVGAAFPFAVIGAIAAWQQLRRPSPKQVEAALQALRALGTAELLDVAGQAWRTQGYEVRRAAQPGADLELERQGQHTLVSLRRWKAANLGVEAMRELQVACQRHGQATGWMLVGGGLSDKARDFARDAGLRLVPAAELAQLAQTSGALHRVAP